MDQLKLSSFTACCKSVSNILTSLGHWFHGNEIHYTDNIGSFSVRITKLHLFQGTLCFIVIFFLIEVIPMCLNQSCYKPGMAQRFQEVKVPRFHDNGTGRW